MRRPTPTKSATWRSDSTALELKSTTWATSTSSTWLARCRACCCQPIHSRVTLAQQKVCVKALKAYSNMLGARDHGPLSALLA